MYRKIIITFLIVFIPFSFSFPQTNKIDFLLSNSIGYDFDKSAPSFFVNLSTEIDKGVFIGLRAGIFAYDKNLDDAAYDGVNPIFQSLPVGSGYITFPILKQAPSYIAAFQGAYTFFEKISINLSFGARFYQEKNYTASATYYKPTSNITLPPFILNLDSEVDLISTKDIIKAYYSLGVDYHLSSFRLGVFADNIFSFGINIGKEF